MEGGAAAWRRIHHMDPAAQPTGALLRFDLPCDTLGFEPPPVAVQLRFLPEATRWTLVVVVPPGKAGEVASWASRQAPMQVHVAPGLAPRVLRCELEDLPPQWLAWLTTVRVVQADIAPHGMATLFVQGTPAQLARLATALGDPLASHHRLYGLQALNLVPLTARQLEVLGNAVALGYYDVPHRVDLRQLGKSMNLSVSAVSQLLRRAQAHVIRSFVDANTLARGSRTDPQVEAPARPPKGA